MPALPVPFGRAAGTVHRCQTMRFLPDSPRLSFRLLTRADAPLVVATATDGAVMRYISGQPRSRQEALAEMERWLALDDGRHGLFVAEDKQTGEFAGFFILRQLEQTGLTETGFRLPAHQWGKGYASEGARAILEYAFKKLDPPCIVAVVEEGNLASRRVLEKNGFENQGTRVHYGADLFFYKLTRERFTTGR